LKAAVHSRLVRRVKGRMRLRMHSESGRNVQEVFGHEDSSAAQAEDAKFENSQGFIIDF